MKDITKLNYNKKIWEISLDIVDFTEKLPQEHRDKLSKLLKEVVDMNQVTITVREKNGGAIYFSTDTTDKTKLRKFKEFMTELLPTGMLKKVTNNMLKQILNILTDALGRGKIAGATLYQGSGIWDNIITDKYDFENSYKLLILGDYTKEDLLAMSVAILTYFGQEMVIMEEFKTNLVYDVVKKHSDNQNKELVTNKEEDLPPNIAAVVETYLHKFKN